VDSTPTLETIRRLPRCCSTTTSTVGSARPRSSSWPRSSATQGFPTTDVDELAVWFRAGADRKDLGLYLETFQHTVGVMQHRDALVRVARECAEDLAADGIVYAEVRFAPELHVEQGLTLDEVVDAVQEGFRQGRAPTGRITIGTIVTAMRTAANSREIAELAVRHRDTGVVGFDIAGKEEGYPPSRHLDAFQYVQRENFHITIHAGEAFGLPSIWEALQWCNAERLGPRGAHRRRHHRRPRGRCSPRSLASLRARPEGCRSRCAPPPTSTRACAPRRRAPDRVAGQAQVPGDGQHRQPADERISLSRASSPAWSTPSATAGTTSSGSRSTR
jgi:hypothetical protein